jgi:hypothetical protein
MSRKVNRFRFEYMELEQPSIHFNDSPDPSDFEEEMSSTYEYEGVVGESRRIIGRIQEAIDNSIQNHASAHPETVVVGVEDYLAADAWIRYDSNDQKCLNSVLSVDIVTVPGRMIHVPKQNERAMIDHLKETLE